MKRLITILLLLSSTLAFAGNQITWSWTDSGTTYTYNIYQVQITGATASSICPVNPTYTLLVGNLPAGSTNYKQSGTPGTLYCSVATATDPATGLESVYSNQAGVFLPAAPPPPLNFAGSHN